MLEIALTWSKASNTVQSTLNALRHRTRYTASSASKAALAALANDTRPLDLQADLRDALYDLQHDGPPSPIIRSTYLQAVADWMAKE